MTPRVDTSRREQPYAAHRLPLGAVVIYRAPGDDAFDGGDIARLVIVAHSRDNDGEPLYAAAKAAVAPPPEQYALYSYEHLAYRLLAGWYVGDAPIRAFLDTGERIAVRPFDLDRHRHPNPAGAATVHVVTSGQYSAYRIRGVYLDEDLARARTALINRGDPFEGAVTQSWPGDGTLPEGGKAYWEIEMDPDGEWDTVYLEIADTPPFDGEIRVERRDLERVSVVALDLDRGLKVAADVVAEIKAHRAGLT